MCNQRTTKTINQRTIKIVICILIFLLGLSLGGMVVADCQNVHKPEQEELDFPGDNEIVEVELTLDDHIMNIVPKKLQNGCKAIILVESEGKADAISPGGHYIGILQLGKIYVRECNRIQDSVTFTYTDRYDIVKSLQMFTIYQNYHNPSHDLNKAIKLHNPTAGPEYRTKVLRSLQTIY